MTDLILETDGGYKTIISRNGFGGACIRIIGPRGGAVSCESYSPEQRRIIAEFLSK